jgi:DNA-binding transcriptional MerR regulator
LADLRYFEMERAAEIATLRALGFSLAQIGRVLRGYQLGLEAALAAHQAILERPICTLAETIRAARIDLAQGKAPSVIAVGR